MSEPSSLGERVLVAVYRRSYGQLIDTDGMMEQLGVSHADFTATCGELERFGLAKPRFKCAPQPRFPRLIELTDSGFRRAEQLLR